MSGYRPPAHGGQRRWAAEAFGRDASRWLDFSANLNPLGPPAKVLAALGRALDEVAVYPDLEAKEATRAVAGYLGVDPEIVLLTSGGMEALFLIVRALSPAVGMVSEPAFGGYGEALQAAGVPYVGVTRPLPELLSMDLPDRALVVVGQPANPTGRLADPELLRALGSRLAARGGCLLIDEAFIDFLEDPEAFSLRRDVGRERGLAIAGSLTKFFTLPGLRLGYALVAGGEIASLKRQQVPWSVGALTQVAASEAVADREFALRSRRFFPPVRRALALALREMRAFRVEEGCANYLLLDASPSGMPACAWTRGAARRGILLRDASNFAGLTRYHLRIAVRSPAENERLVGTLGEVLREAKAAP